ncbi:hypothetical protein GCM10009753_23730 [Streptantibioticus ferralitis]
MRSLQQFVNQPPCVHTAVLRAVVAKTVPVVDAAVWVIDDVSFPKAPCVDVAFAQGEVVHAKDAGRGRWRIGQ